MFKFFGNFAHFDNLIITFFNFLQPSPMYWKHKAWKYYKCLGSSYIIMLSTSHKLVKSFSFHSGRICVLSFPFFNSRKILGLAALLSKCGLISSSASIFITVTVCIIFVTLMEDMSIDYIFISRIHKIITIDHLLVVQ